MLVIKRKSGQVLYIGDDITVTVVEVRMGEVSLGVDAPPQVKVGRPGVHFSGPRRPPLTPSQLAILREDRLTNNPYAPRP